MTLRIGWFTTARGPGSRAMYEAVADAVARGRLDAEFAFVFSNRERGEDPATDALFDLVEANGRPLLTVSSVRYRHEVGGQRSAPGAPLPPWRLEYDRAVEALVEPHPFDVGVLAGYMLIFEREFVARHPLLNLHPALPGVLAGTWREVISHLIRTRATESGVMLNLAIPEVDAGPVVAYCRYTLRDAELAPLWAALDGTIDSLDDDALEATPLFAAIRERGVRHEAPFLVATLSAFAEGALRIEDARILDAAGHDREPADLTPLVEAALASTSRA